MVAGLAVALALAVFVFYCRTLQQTLRAAAPANQRMPPWQAWLLIIPLFNIVFSFIAAARISDTIKAEAASRKLPVPGRPTYAAGVAMSIMGTLSYLPIVGSIGGLGCVVCWILHWVQVAEWNRKLRSENGVSDSERVLFEYGPSRA